MRGVKDEEKNACPLFPKLHVKDSDTGGPKAPPRNKMALNEQFSIPPQRSTSGSPSFPAPPGNNNNHHQVPSIIPSDISSYQKSISIQPSLKSADKFHPKPSRGVPLNTIGTTHKLKGSEPVTYNSHFNGSLSMTSKCDSFLRHNLPNFKNFPLNKIGVTDELVVPIAGPVKLPDHNVISALQIQSVIGKKTNPAGSTQLKLTQLVKNHNWKYCQNGRDPEEASAYPFGVSDIANASLSLEVKSPLKQVHESPHHEMGNIAMNTSRNSQDGNDQKIEVYSDRNDSLALADDLFRESSMNEASRSPDKKETSVHIDQKRHENREAELDMNKDHASNKSVKNSKLDTDISPDHVVRIIGEKLFWEARRAIIYQQRTFNMQLFELHRVMKVQKLIADSPYLLLESSHFRKLPSLDSVEKRSASEDVTNLPVFTSRIPDEPMNAEYPEYNTAGKLLLPSAENLANLQVVPHSINEHQAEKAALAPTASHCKQSPWNLQNQWLVPYMSPSEGLVYKPFTGPCPPAAGFTAPFYGSCVPVKLNSGSREFADASYSVSANLHGNNILSGTPLGQLYPPCPIPPLNTSLTLSEVEQGSPFDEMKPNGNVDQRITGDNGEILHHQSSCKTSSRLSQIISGEHENHGAYEETELQTIPDSIQTERTNQNVLSLFPTTPTLKASSDDNVDHQRPRVIKVQPHNPKSASESAARIFKRIQEERDIVNSTAHIDSKSLISSSALLI